MLYWGVIQVSSLHADLWSRYGTRSPLPVAEIVPILGPRVDLLKDAAAGAREPEACRC